MLPPGTRSHPSSPGGGVGELHGSSHDHQTEHRLSSLEWSDASSSSSSSRSRSSGGGGGGSSFPGSWVQVERFVVPRYVAVGSNVSLECDYVVQRHATLYSLKWYKGSSQFYQYIPTKTEQPHVVFSVPGLHLAQLVGGREGRVVTVVGVGVGASDVYRCELVAEGPPFHTTQRSANMTVVVLPGGRPTITGAHAPYHLNERIHLTCTAPPSWPLPTLTWTLNGHQVRGTSVGPVEVASTSYDMAITNTRGEQDRVMSQGGLDRTTSHGGLDRATSRGGLHKATSTTTNPGGLEMATTHLSLQVAQHNFRDGGMTIVCDATLGSLYHSSHQVIIPEPSNTWYSTLNLYHASGHYDKLYELVGVDDITPLPTPQPLEGNVFTERQRTQPVLVPSHNKCETRCSVNIYPVKVRYDIQPPL
ncbi:hypothetical protein Pmani_025448 [Petrolisthes manimaculis]|uniref:Immunoglobulin domain-containing protein n=1 Tax=Petrolisthes manimaculis TaxID=1843537 RepID=A0AAE1U162_9EUCA|nr:hypothetical protein Pmani_025448 [Petrolisthes manimaculis]